MAQLNSQINWLKHEQEMHAKNLQNQIKENYNELKDHDTRIQHIEDQVNTTAAQAANMVGFSAYATEDRNYDSGDVVIFDEVILNAGKLHVPGELPHNLTKIGLNIGMKDYK